MSEHLGANLKLLCSHYRSISEICRQLAINRAQFNKYLSGQSQPTPYNRKRIGDFFGVEDYELGLPPEQFARLIGARTSAQPRQPSNDPLLRLLQPLRAEAGDLGRYCGYYFEYANCMSVPGSILLSLVHLYEEDGVFLFERQERQERTSSTDAGGGVGALPLSRRGLPVAGPGVPDRLRVADPQRDEPDHPHSQFQEPYHPPERPEDGRFQR